MRRVMMILAALAVLGTSLVVLGGLPEDPPATTPGDEVVPLAGTNPDGEAPVTLTVVPTARELDPVAVPELLCEGGDADICQSIRETLARDLGLSAFFTVLPAQSYLADMGEETLQRTKWDDWFNVGAKYLIKVEVKSHGAEHDIAFRLYDVSNRAAMEVKGQDAEGTGTKKVVPRTHAFVNEVIRTITGAPGFFGSILLYSSRTGKDTRSIWAIDIDGSGRRVLAGGPTLNMFPSMVGGTLVYTSFASGKPDIFIDGVQITRDWRQYRGARLSPDGGILAVSADDGGQSEIFLMGTDGEIRSNLTNSWCDEVSPCWSPGGDLLAYVSNCSGGPQVHVMNRDGSGQRRVTFAGNYNSTPDFGPDGRIVFAGMDGGASDIFVTDLSGNLQRITQDQGNNKDPAFSPDGRHIVFVSNRGGGWRIWIATADGRYQNPLTEKPGGYSTLFWPR